MARGKNYNVPRTIKLDSEEDFNLQRHCEKLGVDVSSFIREAINERLNSGHISNIAGQNILEFNQKSDSFVWKVKLDNSEEKIILDNIPTEFLEDLDNKIKLKLHERNQLLQKTSKKSIPVPRRLVR